MAIAEAGGIVPLTQLLKAGVQGTQETAAGSLHALAASKVSALAHSSLTAHHLPLIATSHHSSLTTHCHLSPLIADLAAS